MKRGKLLKNIVWIIYYELANGNILRLLIQSMRKFLAMDGFVFLCEKNKYLIVRKASIELVICITDQILGKWRIL